VKEIKTNLADGELEGVLEVHWNVVFQCTRMSGDEANDVSSSDFGLHHPSSRLLRTACFRDISDGKVIVWQTINLQRGFDLDFPSLRVDFAGHLGEELRGWSLARARNLERINACKVWSVNSQ
jgi:hypothetical protein